MGQVLTSAWNDVSLLSGDAALETENKPRIKAMDRTAGYLAQDPRSPARQGTDVSRTPIQLKEENGNNDSGVADDTSGGQTTPIGVKVLPFDPRSPGVERSPIVVPAEDGTPVTATPVLKSKSLATQLGHSIRQRALNKAS